MRNILFKKGLIIGIIGLLILTTILPATGTLINKNIKLEEQNTSDKQDNPINSNSDSIDWWPMYQHDPQNTGYSTSKAPNTNNVLWTYNAKKCRGLLSCPVVVDGRVYIGGDGEDLRWFRLIEKDLGGKLYCIDATTGGHLWMIDYPIEGNLHNNILAAPVVDEDKVFVCPMSDDNPYGEIHCYNALNGDLLWEKKDIGGVSFEGITVSNGKLYAIALVDGFFYRKVYCLNTTNGDILWDFYEEGLNGCPAVVNNKVYICRRIGDGNFNDVYCLNASSGDPIWNWQAPYNIKFGDSPTVIDDKLYICAEGLFEIPGAIFCINAQNGDTIWMSEVRNNFRRSVAYYNSKIYAQCYDMFYCFNADTGKLIWKQKIQVAVDQTLPIIADNKVFIYSPSHFNLKYYCFDALTGNIIWTLKIPGFFTLCLGSAIADGQLYFPFGNQMIGEDGTVYCISDIDSNAPEAPEINGPTSGKPGIIYNYSIMATDPNGDDIYYYITWGDGTKDEWFGPYSSGETVSINHSWSDKGQYEIRARAKDSNELRGAIGILKFTMPRAKSISNSPLLRFLERYPLLYKIYNFFVK